MNNPPLQFEEVSPEVIGSVENGKVKLDSSAIPVLTPEQQAQKIEMEKQAEVEEVPEDTTPPMPEEMEALKEELNKEIDNFLVKVGALKQGENKIVESLKSKHTERDEKDKVEKETRKTTLQDRDWETGLRS